MTIAAVFLFFSEASAQADLEKMMMGEFNDCLWLKLCKLLLADEFFL
jgi:hypothetical protein